MPRPGKFHAQFAGNSSGTRVAKSFRIGPVSVCARWPSLYKRGVPYVQAALQPNFMPTAGSPEAAAKPSSLLELRAVTKTFGQLTALASLEASVASGEFVTVVGPSGCGKSTLFNIVAGLEEPGAGRILHLQGNTLPPPALLPRVSLMPHRHLLFPP